MNWYTGQFAAHVMAETIPERNRWTKAVVEKIQQQGEIMLPDGSPMFVKNIGISHKADPLREGQILFTGQYGVLAQRRNEYAQPPLNRAVITNLKMEVRADGK